MDFAIEAIASGESGRRSDPCKPIAFAKAAKSGAYSSSDRNARSPRRRVVPSAKQMRSAVYHVNRLAFSGWAGIAPLKCLVSLLEPNGNCGDGIRWQRSFHRPLAIGAVNA